MTSHRQWLLVATLLLAISGVRGIGTPHPILPDSVYTGEIQEAGLEEVFQISPPLGHRVLLDLNLPDSGALKALWTAPSGQVLLEATNRWMARVALPVKEFGPHQLRIRSNHRGTGIYQIRILDPDTAPPLVLNGVTHCQLSASRPVQAFQCDLNRDEQLRCEPAEGLDSVRWSLIDPLTRVLATGPANQPLGPIISWEGGPYLLLMELTSPAAQPFRMNFVPRVSRVPVQPTQGLGELLTGVIPPRETNTFRLFTTGSRRVYLDPLQSPWWGFWITLRDSEQRIVFTGQAGGTLGQPIQLPGGAVTGELFSLSSFEATPYQVRFLDLDAAPSFHLGDEVPGATDIDPGAQAFQFHGVAGQRITYSTIPGQPRPAWDSPVILLGPAALTESGTSSIDAKTPLITLPVTGNYFVVQLQGRAPGWHGFRLVELTNAPSLTVPPGWSWQLAGDEDRAGCQIEITNGGRWSMTVFQNNLIEVYSPKGTRIASGERSPGFQFSAEVPGTYGFILFSAPGFRNSGSLFLSPILVKTNELSWSIPVTTTGTADHGEVYFLDGQAGQRLLFQDLVTIPAPFGYVRTELTLLDPEGIGLSPFHGGDQLVRLESNGRHLLRAKPEGQQSGTMEFQASNIEAQPLVQPGVPLSLSKSRSTVLRYPGRAQHLIQMDIRSVGTVNSIALHLQNNVPGQPTPIPFNGVWRSEPLSQDGEVVLALHYTQPGEVTFQSIFSPLPIRIDETNQVSVPFTASIQASTNEGTYHYLFPSKRGDRLFYQTSQGLDAVSLSSVSHRLQLVAEDGIQDYRVPAPTVSYSGQTWLFRTRVSRVSDAPTLELHVPITNQVPTPRRWEIFQFDASAGQALVCHSPTLASYDDWAEVYGPDLELLTADANYRSDLTFVTQRAGRHIVLLRSLTTNAYSVLLTEPVQLKSTVTLGSWVGGSPNFRPVEHRYLLPVAEGARLFLEMASAPGAVIPVTTRISGPGEVESRLTSPMPIPIGPLAFNQSGNYSFFVGSPFPQLSPPPPSGYHFRWTDLQSVPELQAETPFSSVVTNQAEGILFRYRAQAGHRIRLESLSQPDPAFSWTVYDPFLIAQPPEEPSGEFVMRSDGEYVFYGRSSSTYLGIHPVRTESWLVHDIPPATVLPAGLDEPKPIRLQPGETKTVEVVAQAGQRITYGTPPQLLAGVWTPVISATDPDGLPIYSRVLMGLEKSGTYTFSLVNPSSEPVEFEFTVVNLDHAPLIDARDGQREHRRFPVPPGWHRLIPGLGDFSPTSSLLDARGSSTDRNTLLLANTTYFFNYTLNKEGNTGPNVVLLRAGESSELSVGTEISLPLAPGESQFFRLPKTDSRRLRFNSLSSTASGAWSIVRMATFQLNQLFATNLARSFNFTTATTGEELLRISNGGLNQVTFRFRVEKIADQDLRIKYGETVTNQFIVGDEVHLYRFDGALGDRILLDGLSSTSANQVQTLLLPSGTKVATSPGFLSKPVGADSSGFSLPQTGDYTLVVSKNGSGPGSYAFRVVSLDSQPLIEIGKPFTNLLRKDHWEFQRFMANAGDRLLLTGLSNTPKSSLRFSLNHATNLQPSSASELKVFQTGEQILGFEPSAPLAETLIGRLQMVKDFTNAASVGVASSGLIEQPGDRHYFEFNAVRNHVYFLDSLALESTPLQWKIINRSPTNAAFDIGPFLATDAGPTIVEFSTDLRTGGNYRFRILDLTSEETPRAEGRIEGTLEPAAARHWRIPSSAETRYYLESIQGIPGATWSIISRLGATLRQAPTQADLEVHFAAAEATTLLVTSPATGARENQAQPFYFQLHPFSDFRQVSVNQGPLLSPVPDLRVREGDPVEWRWTAADPDGGLLAFRLLGNVPTGAVLSPSGTLRYTPAVTGFPRTEEFLINVIDDGLPWPLSDTQLWRLTVIAPPTLTSVEMFPAGVRLRWRSLPGEVYQIQFKEGLDQPWATLVDDLRASSAETQFDDLTIPTAKSRFYRVVSPEFGRVEGAAARSAER